MNSGNANAFTGDRGLKDASDLTSCVAEGVGFQPCCSHVTGVIGNPLPIDRMSSRIAELISRLDGRSFIDVAVAIMTTLTFPKPCYLRAL